MAKSRLTKGSALTYAEMDEVATQLDLIQDTVFFSSNKTITKNITIPSGRNYMSVGEISLDSGVTITLADSADWTII